MSSAGINQCKWFGTRMPDQAGHNVRPDLDPNFWHLMVFQSKFLENILIISFEKKKIADDKKQQHVKWKIVTDNLSNLHG